jgi:hypothetical protein
MWAGHSYTRRATGRGWIPRRLALAGSVATLLLAADASTTAASVTIGQLGFSGAACPTASDEDWLQPTVVSGNSYVVPSLPPLSNFLINSWSTSAGAGAGQVLTMKVFRQVAGNRYTVVGHDGPRPLTPSTVNTFPASVPAKAGDVLGFKTTGGSPSTRCVNLVGAPETYLALVGNLQDGESDDFNTFPQFRLNVSAVVVPANTFTLGDVKRNRNKGTARITVTVPNPGELSASGKGVKAAGGASRAKAVSAAGEVELTIKAKGKKRRKLNETGKVKLNPTVTFVPTGGDPSSQTTKLKLKKR